MPFPRYCRFPARLILPLAALLSTLLAGRAEAQLSGRAANAISYSVLQYSWSGLSSAGGITSRWSDAGNWTGGGLPLRHAQPFPGIEIFDEVTINLDTQAVDRAVRLDTLNTLVFYDHNLYGLHFAGSRQVSLTGDNVWPVDSDGKFQTQYPPSPFPLSIWMGGMSNHSPFPATFSNIDLTVDGSQEWKAVNGGFDLSSVLLGSSALTLLGGQPVTMGALTGHGSITWATRAGYAAPGVLEIGSAASFSGLVDIGTGTLKLTNDVGAAFAFNGRIIGSGPVIITGNRTLAGPDAYTHTGEMQMSGGVLLLNKTSINGTVTGSALRASSAIVRLAQANQIGDAVAVHLSIGSTLDLGVHQEAIGTLELTGSSVVGSGRLILTGGSVNVLADSSDSIISTEVDMNDVLTTWNVVGDLQSPGRLTRGNIVKQGAGKLTLSADNSLTGITHEAGTIVVTRDAALAPTFTFKGGTLQFAAGFDSLAPHRQFTVAAAGGTLDTNGRSLSISIGTPLGGAGTLAKTGAGTLALATGSSVGGIDLRNGVLQVSGSTHIGAFTLTSGSLQAGADVAFSASSTWNLPPAAGQAAGTANLSSIDTNSVTIGMPGVISGSGGLTVDGGGTLNLGGANTYTGVTKVDGSTLGLASVASLGGSTVLLLQNGARLLVSGTSVTFGGQLLVQGDLGVIDISGGTFTSNGGVTGTGQLQKRGTGELRLNGANSLSGELRVVGGKLALETAQSAGTATGIVLEGGTLRLLSPMTLAVPVTSFADGSAIDVGANNIILSQPLGGTLIKQGPGTLTLAAAGNGTFAALTIAAGLVEFSAASSLAWNITLDAGGLRWAAGSTADISDRLAAINAGGGTLDLGANNVTFAQGRDWTGPVTKSGPGRLTLTGGGAFLGGLVVQGGVVAFNEAQARTIPQVISGFGAVEHLGAAVLTLGGANTFGGGLTVAGGGDVIIPDGGTPGTGSVNLQNGRLVFDQGLDATFGSSIGGAGSVVKNGTGMLTLSGANNFTGGVAVSGGTLVAAHATALGTAGNITLDAAVLRVTATLTLASSRQVSLGGGSALETGPGAVLTVNGVISGGPLLKSGAGTLVLGNANTFTGQITVNGGTLGAAHAGALGSSNGLLLNAATFRADTTLATAAGYGVDLRNGAALEAASGATLTLAGVVSGGPLVKNGAGALVLTNTNIFTGGIVLNGGTLTGTLAALPGNVTGTGGTLRVDEGGSAGWNVQVSGGVALEFFNSTTSFGVMNLDATTRLTHSGSTQIGGGVLMNLNAANTLSSGSALIVNGQLDLAGGSQTVASLAGSGLIYSFNANAVTAILANGVSNASTTFSGILADNTGYGAGKLALWKAGTGELTLTNANTFTGGIIVSGDGTLYGTQAGAFGSAGDFTLSNGNLRTGATFTIPATRAILLHGSGDTINVDAGTRLTIDSVLSGAALLTKSGGGTLVPTNANTFSGGLRLVGGLIEFTTNAQLGTGMITADGGGLRWTPGSTTDISPRLNALGSGGGLFDIQDNDITFATALTGSGGLTKDGSGTLTLAANPTYTGATTVRAGKLIVTNGSPRGVVIVAAGAELQVNGPMTSPGLAGDGPVTLGSGTLTLNVPAGVFTSYNSVITTTGSVIKNGPGTQAFAGANAYSGGTTLNAGVLQINGDPGLGASGGVVKFDGGTLRWGLPFNLGAAREITLLGGGGQLDTSTYTTTITQGISGSGALTKLGIGILSLQGVNTFTGGIHLNEGILVGHAASLPGSIFTAAGTILHLDQNTDAVWNASLSGAGRVDLTSTQNFGIIRMGAGHTHTHSGPTLIGAGLYFVAGGTNSLSAASAYTVNGSVDLNANTQTISSLAGSGEIYSYSLTTATGTLITNGDGSSTTFSGRLKDNTGFDSGILALVKNGSGTLTLSGTNTFSGGVTVNSGFIAFNTAANLGSGRITLDGGGLRWTGGSGADVSARLNAIGTNGAYFDTGAGTVAFGTALTGGGTVSKSGAGLLQLASLGSFTGNIHIDNGSLGIGIGGGESHTYGGSVSGIGYLYKQGGGTLTLTGTSHSFGGVFVIDSGGVRAGATNLPGANILNNGTLWIEQTTDATLGSAIGGGGSLFKNGGGTLTLSAANTYFGNTHILGGYVEVGAADSLSNSLVKLDGGGLKWGPGVTTSFYFDGPDSIGPDGAFFDTNGNNVVLQGRLYGSGSLVKNGAGSLTLPLSFYAGETVVNGGTLITSTINLQTLAGLRIAAGAELWLDQSTAPAHMNFLLAGTSGAGAFTIVNTAAPLAVLQLRNGVRLAHTGATTIGTNVALVVTASSGVNSLGVSSPLTVNGILDLGGMDQTVGALSGGGEVYSATTSPSAATLTVAQAGGTSTYSGVLKDTTIAGLQGVLALKKIGAGTLVLSGGNSFSSGLTVNGGLVEFTSGGNLGSGAITLDGGGLRWAAGSTVDLSPRLRPLGTSGGTFDTGASDVRFATTLTGTGALVKLGSGRLTLTELQHTGVTHVAEGTLEARVTTSAVTVLTGNGWLVKSGGGMLTLDSGGSHYGTTTVTEGALVVNSHHSGTITVQNGAKLGGDGMLGYVTLEGGSTLTPGNSSGTLTFTSVAEGSFDFQSGSSVQMEITLGGGPSDLLNFIGSGGSTLNFLSFLRITANTLVPTQTETFNLLDWSGLVSAPDFASHFSENLIRDGSQDNGSAWDLPDIGTTGLLWDLSQFTLNGTIQIVPEPGRGLLLLAGLFIAGLRRARNSRRPGGG